MREAIGDRLLGRPRYVRSVHRLQRKPLEGEAGEVLGPDRVYLLGGAQFRGAAGALAPPGGGFAPRHGVARSFQVDRGEAGAALGLEPARVRGGDDEDIVALARA